jgi:primary-amine oxidase
MAPSLEQAVQSLPLIGGKTTTKPSNAAAPQHPIGPLTAAEIATSSGLVRAFWPEGTLFTFKTVTLLEPAKKELLPYLEAEQRGEKGAEIERKAFVVYYIKNTVC